MVASYSELYEEGEVDHINGVWPDFLLKIANFTALIIFIKATPHGCGQFCIKTPTAHALIGLLSSYMFPLSIHYVFNLHLLILFFFFARPSQLAIPLTLLFTPGGWVGPLI